MGTTGVGGAAAMLLWPKARDDNVATALFDSDEDKDEGVALVVGPSGIAGGG